MSRVSHYYPNVCDKHIDVENKLNELDQISDERKATHAQIKDYI